MNTIELLQKSVGYIEANIKCDLTLSEVEAQRREANEGRQEIK